MGWFGSGKKSGEKDGKPACACGGVPAGAPAEAPCCGGAEEGICCIKVLGSGCKNCHTLLESTRAAVESMGLGIEPEYVTDLEKILAYGAMSMPALVVNEKVVSEGRVLRPADVEKLLRSLGA